MLDTSGLARQVTLRDDTVVRHWFYIVNVGDVETIELFVE